MVGHPTPVEDDPTGTRYAFEAGADNWLNPEGAMPAELKTRTFTNQRPTWLANAHAALDAAVLAAYGWPADLSDEAILERLLALNLERAAGQGTVAAPAEEGEEPEGA